MEDSVPFVRRRRPVRVGNIWTAACSFGGRQNHLGSFSTEAEAQAAIDAFREANPTIRRRMLPSSRDLSVRVLNEETQFFQQAPALDVIQSGEKELMTIRAANGSVLRCTEDHAIYTEDGWRKAAELEPGQDRIAVASKRSLYTGRKIPPSLRRGIGVWTSMQRQTLIRPIDYCSECSGQFLREELVLDHIVPVAEDLRRALDLANLQPLCISCHRVKTDSEQKLARRGMGAGSRFVPFTIDDGRQVEMTYDLSVEGPWHNFVANGVVVHNSYNEESGRYRELQPVFYVPGEDRRLVQQGKAGEYNFVDGTPDQHDLVVNETKRAYTEAYEAYKRMLEGGIAREVARTVLPVGIYSSMYVTCNARSLMAFLSLRTKREDSKFPSYPQREIEMVAEKMEAEWARLMPITYEAFNANGRVSP
jgi:thymidylate synthase (FAD)